MRDGAVGLEGRCSASPGPSGENQYVNRSPRTGLQCKGDQVCYGGVASRGFAGSSPSWPLCIGYGSGLSCEGAMGVKGVS